MSMGYQQLLKIQKSQTKELRELKILRKLNNPLAKAVNNNGSGLSSYASSQNIIDFESKDNNSQAMIDPPNSSRFLPTIATN